MNTFKATCVAAALTCGSALANEAIAPARHEKHDLRVLILAKAGSERAEEYRTFLAQHFAAAEVRDMAAFEQSDAREFDVVLLDWRQDEIDHQGGGFKSLESPLGQRETWQKPTLLLGSAGLLLSAPWQTSGSYG